MDQTLLIIQRLGQLLNLLRLFILKLNQFQYLTDASFNREKWNDKKSQILDYFNSQYVRRLHMNYVRHYILFKMFSCAFIVSN